MNCAGACNLPAVESQALSALDAVQVSQCVQCPGHRLPDHVHVCLDQAAVQTASPHEQLDSFAKQVWWLNLALAAGQSDSLLESHQRCVCV